MSVAWSERNVVLKSLPASLGQVTRSYEPVVPSPIVCVCVVCVCVCVYVCVCVCVCVVCLLG